MKELRVAVIGGSIAGLTAAIGLSRLPHAHIDVFERLSESAVINGALYQIWPNGLHALNNISEHALREVMDRAWPLERIVHRDASGALLRKFEVPVTKYGRPGINITRQALIEGLRAALPQGIAIRYNCAVSQVQDEPTQLTLQLEGGERTAPYDLLLIADGRTSRFRHLVAAGGPELSEHGWSAFVGQSGEVAELAQASRHHDFQIFYGKGSVCGVCPLGDRVTWFLTFTDKTEAAVYKAMGKKGALDEADLQTKYDFAKTLTADWFSTREPFYSITNADWRESSETVPVLWRMKDLQSPRHIARGRLALVGDAGHVLLPVTGQGAAMAFEDVSVLVDCLRTAAVPDALRAYQTLRIPRLRQVFRLTRMEAQRSYEPDNVLATSLRKAALRFTPDTLVDAVLDQLMRPPS